MRIDRAYPRWIARQQMPRLPDTGMLLSIVMPVFDTPAGVLVDAIGSVRCQTYRDWELCIVDDASTAAHVPAMLDAARRAEPRIRVVRLPSNSGIAASTNAGIAIARGAFFALLDHDDLLAPHALARVAAEIAAHPDADLIFSDEDKLEGGVRCRPYFKPDWNPDLMLGQNMVSHFGVYRRAGVMELGGVRQGFDGSQDYDLALRMGEACGTARIRHIPDVLYHWRQSPASFSASRATQASQAARRAVARHVPPGSLVAPDSVLPHWSRIVHPVPDPMPLVSLIAGHRGPVPFDAACPDVERCAEAGAARGAVIVLLAPGLSAAEPGWLRELVGQALRPGVGAAGARLDRPDGRIVQSGLILNAARIAHTIRPRADLDDPGYVGHFRLARTVSALSRDCLAIRRDLFMAAGGIDPACGPYGDVDLCLRLAKAGLRCVWTPYARLRYTLAPYPLFDRRAARLMRARWGEALAHDPTLNPNLVVRHGNLALRVRPPRPRRIAE